MAIRLQPLKATQRQTRTHNSSLVLKTIYDQGRVSRADIARLTHLTRTSVSEMVAELQERGLVEEVGMGQSIGGRSPILLSIVDDARHLLSLDLGSGAFRGAVVNLRNQVIATAEVPFPTPTGDTALAQLYKLIERLLAETTRPILGIGIGTPGLVDTTSGNVVSAVNLDWHNLPVSDLLQERYNLPVYVANDSQISALAHYIFSKDLTGNLVLIKTGQGVGAGIILNGQLFQGDGFGAGEIGHIVVQDGGALCRCGNAGCLETVIGEQAILANSPHPTVKAIGTAASSGDAAALLQIDTLARYLGIACANLVGSLNARRIVLSGSITALGAPFLSAVRREARQRSLPTLAQSTSIEMGEPNPDAVIHGASVLVLSHELGFSLTN